MGWIGKRWRQAVFAALALYTALASAGTAFACVALEGSAKIVVTGTATTVVVGRARNELGACPPLAPGAPIPPELSASQVRICNLIAQLPDDTYDVNLIRTPNDDAFQRQLPHHECMLDAAHKTLGTLSVVGGTGTMTLELQPDTPQRPSERTDTSALCIVSDYYQRASMLRIVII